MIEFQTPQISAEKVEDNRGTFTIEPLDRGFGYTFGNSLRRVLLSSLAGAAVTSVRIEGVAHEFSTINGVKEDVTDIVLNLKEIVCRMHSDAAEIEAPLVVTGPGEVTAGDIDLPSGVEILNPETHIATLEKKTKLEIYLTIGHGRGYSPAEDNKTPDQPIGVIPIDSIFSPVKRVAYSVDAARVGQKHRLRQAHASTSRPTARSTRRRRCARPPRSSSSTWRSSPTPIAWRPCATRARRWSPALRASAPTAPAPRARAGWTTS